MEQYKIQSTISTRPSACKTPELLCIARGATATLTHFLTKDIYDLDDLDQVTFMLKQGQSILWYQMYTYLVKTEDTVPIADKTYYTDVQSISNTSLYCTGTLVKEPIGNPKTLGYYEVAMEPSNRKTTIHLLDPHFAKISDGTNSYISLILFPEDTLQLKPTTCDNLVECEIALKLDTEHIAELGFTDSVIVERQAPLAVIDTLYSKII